MDAIHGGFNFKILRKVDAGFSIGTIPDGFDFNNRVNIGFETKYKFGESKTFNSLVWRFRGVGFFRIYIKYRLLTSHQTRKPFLWSFL